MTNTEIIQAIRNEIERLKGQLIRGACAAQIEMETNCKEAAYDEVLSFLSTLESEKPMQDGLEEEIKNYFQGYWPGTETVEQCNTDLHFTPPAIIRLASHFAQWGAERQKVQDDRLVDIIYQQGIEKGKDEIRKTLKRKEKK